MTIYHGTILYSQDQDTLAVWEDSYLIEENGFVKLLSHQLPEDYQGLPITDYKDKLIIPAFSDLHIHAPQYPQRGIAMDKLLSDWLSEYTFPQEARFADPEYAGLVYTRLVEDMMRHGTFQASIYGTIHRESTNVLFDILEKKGMSAFVGKINMDRNAPEYLCENTEQSLLETRLYLEEHSGSKKVRPILTPRFAPTCSRELLKGLGKLAAEYQCGMQTHLVESKWEAQEALRLFPDCTSDTQIYEQSGLLEGGTAIMGHVIFPSEEDLRLIKQYSALCVHCPDATTNVIAGIMPAGNLMDQGLQLALGTDVGAGQNVPVYRQIARTVQLSKLKEFYEPQDNRTVTFPQAFYLATKSGGRLWDRVGSLEAGYHFTALVLGGIDETGRELTPEQRLERFCYFGDDRNIEAGYIDGIKVI